MPLLNVVLTLIVVGILLWLVNTYIPMDGKIKNILNIVVVVAVVVWLLNVFGLFDRLGNVRVGTAETGCPPVVLTAIDGGINHDRLYKM